MEDAILPFLKKSHERPAASTGVIIKTRAPDEKPDEAADDSAAPIEACAAELIRAVHAKDTQAVAQAMRDAFEILEATPHAESPEPHSYDAQNQE